MKLYRVTIEPLAAFRSRLQSDTIFGHLMWALRYTGGAGGNQAVTEFLARYQTGAEPPLLVSAGFPAETLPLPVLARPRPDRSGSIADRVVGGMRHKQRAQRPYLPLAEWQTLAAHLSAETLAQAQSRTADPGDWEKKQPLTRTAIDRITGSARQGQLFVKTETFYRAAARFDIWHKIGEGEDLEQVKTWWRWIERNGFGQRKSTGLGAFKITRLLEESDGLLPQVEQPTGFVSLSAWVPAAQDPTEVTYKTRVKRGKLGEQGALPSPWKKPLLMLEPGAVARLPAGEALRDWYGQVVSDIHWTEKEVVQYGLAFPVGVNCA